VAARRQGEVTEDDSRRRAFGVDGAAPLITPQTVGQRAPSLLESGVGAVFSTFASLEDPATALRRLGAWLELDESSASVATTVAEIRAAVAARRLAVVLQLQGTAPFADEPALVTAFAILGVRSVQLTYNYRMLAGDGCFEPHDGGLSRFGRTVVERLDRAGVLVDVSHVGTRTALDAITASIHPVIASHSNARALCDTPRNLTDEVIDAIGENGGVIGVCAFPAFVDADHPSLERLVDHVVYIGERIGIERVSLGLDYADEDEDDYDFYGYDPRYYPRPPWTYPRGIGSYEEFPNIAAELERRGLSGAEVDGVLGENLLRVCEEVWGG
jgi:membrane dipeptidase